MKLGPHLPKLW